MIKELIAQEIRNLLLGESSNKEKRRHPMLGRRCVVRTYSAGVHIGDIVYANGTECRLENSLRLWKWSGGSLALWDVANQGAGDGSGIGSGSDYGTGDGEDTGIGDGSGYC